jgi:hypothetical protein
MAMEENPGLRRRARAARAISLPQSGTGRSDARQGPCGAGNRARSRLSAGWTPLESGPQPKLAAPQVVFLPVDDSWSYPGLSEFGTPRT